MKLNEAVIPHFRCHTIPIQVLKARININEQYLREKSTWYDIEGELKYFKVRADYRMFTEQFFSEFGRRIMDLDTLNYQVSYIRIANDCPESREDEIKVGLLSDNFQRPGYNYYLVSEMLNSEISDLICYFGYSLENLLLYFKQTLSKEDYERDKNFLIRLFLSDAFTMQVDRNNNNIGFEIPKIEGVSYKERLRPTLLEANPNAASCIVVEDGLPRLKGFVPSKVYDNERILGVDHKDMFIYEPGMIWCPIFPYKNDLFFGENSNDPTTQEQARLVSEIDYEGLDPNLAELYMNHSKEARPYIDRLANDDEYRKILEMFSRKNSQIILPNDKRAYFENVMRERKKEFKKVLKILG
jgi:hypothetical protein